jgi:hypothetical protein
MKNQTVSSPDGLGSPITAARRYESILQAAEKVECYDHNGAFDAQGHDDGLVHRHSWAKDAPEPAHRTRR